jgi:hypothetical protein
MSRLDTLIGRRFGQLEVIGYAGSWPPSQNRQPERHWNTQCDCGGSYVAYTSELTGGRVTHCRGCKPQRDDYMKDYQRYREQFTPEQRAYYEEILRGRKGRHVEAEAVDIVMRLPTRTA